MYSITYRITGLMFLLVAATAAILVYLAEWQMTTHFHSYLENLPPVTPGQPETQGIMGTPEQQFLSSVHRSLGWVGVGILAIGLAASYGLARSITVPLLRLSSAVQKIRQGEFNHKVNVTTKDEIAVLANAFNEMAETLDANNRQRKRLLADIAHELRTPLAVIQGNLEGMLEGVIPADKEQLNSLYEETLYLNRIIKDLRDLTLAEAGQLQLDKQPTDLGQILVHAVAMLKPLAEEKEIELTAKLAPLPRLVIDRGRITQAVYNLLTNAIRYTGRNGKIEVMTGALPDGVVIEVRDNGQGIDAADLPHIFDHFYRADKSRTRESGGTGIGLAIVKQIAGLHGGAIEVTSRKGEGSIFKLFLPYHHSNGKAMTEARKPG